MRLRYFFLSLAVLVMVPSHSFAVRLKIATLSPDGSFWMEKMREGAAEVAERTQKRVKIKFYPGGVMGDDRTVLKKIRTGQLQGGAVVAGSLSSVFSDVQIYGLPLKFQSYEEIDFVRETVDPLIIEGLSRGGFVVLGLAEGGFAYMMSSSPIRTVADFRKRKVWIPDNDPTVLEAVKAFDISPIPLSIADVRTGLQTGLIDTVTTSPVGAVTLQWHTQVKYLMDLPFLYIYAALAVDQRAFDKISDEDRPVVREVLGRVFREIDRRNREENVKARDALKKQGIEMVMPPDTARKEWRKLAETVPRRLVESGRFSPDMVKVLEDRLSAFRSENGG